MCVLLYIVYIVAGIRSGPDVLSSAISLSPLTLLSDSKQYSGSTHRAYLRNIVSLSCSDISHEDKKLFFLVLTLASAECNNVLLFSHEEVKNETSFVFSWLHEH